MIRPPKGGHLGGSMSCVEIVTVLYYHKMRQDPANPNWENRDRFIMSKGHSCLTQYAALADLGYIPYKEIINVKSISCNLQGHPDMNKTSGIEASTGSLGQGLSIGVGISLGSKLDKQDYNVYVILGDGEVQEGQVWEAAMSAANYKLDNIIAIIDNNKQESSGFTKDRMDLGDLSAKWKAFGWEVMEINGHDIIEITKALDKADEIPKPFCIVAHTVKGRGVDFAEGKTGFHKAIIDQEEYKKCLKIFVN
jgi:transketolase